MCDRYQKSYRLGRRPGEQGSRALSKNQGRVEKSVTGTNTTTITTNTATATATSPSTAPMETTRKAPTTTTASTATTAIKCDTQTLKTTKDIFTVGTWNVQTLWATGKLELLRHEMK
ncbi:unnamed protein product [Didymodactylos carnosus]|uniref:Uncharacterized protein n=1 Tax=Didymodactylos carnosus TaxID=1234261 RepID=A0A814T092_9BILA|nr:unnamed protein product [Didymodactylos carnosus]CAF3918750.1 unnamed protein product [Didymodactylos carnosus]